MNPSLSAALVSAVAGIFWAIRATQVSTEAKVWGIGARRFHAAAAVTLLAISAWKLVRHFGS